MLEVNCETDFVAKNQLFLKFVEGVGARLLEKEDLVSIEDESDRVQPQFTELLEATEPANIFP